MTRFNPFSPSYVKYGAPMGRADSNADLLSFRISSIAAQHQGGGEGYDRGGVYWGLPSNVWAVWVHGEGPKTVKYLRAITKQDAINKAVYRRLYED